MTDAAQFRSQLNAVWEKAFVEGISLKEAAAEAEKFAEYMKKLLQMDEEEGDEEDDEDLLAEEPFREWY